MKVEVKRKRLFWYVVLKSTNGETVLTSETYFSRGNAERSARRLRALLK